MKRIVSLVSVGLASLVLSGCGGEDITGGMDMHYLTDVNGLGIGDVPYDCAVGGSGTTDLDGGYGFESGGDNCTFIFNSNDTDRPVYIKLEEFGGGVSGLYYTCTYDTGSGNTPYSGYTDVDGHVKHVWNDGGPVRDECTIVY